MKPKLYLDGCSFVWGEGLAPEYNLESHFSKEFDVTNFSRGGKSNLAMAIDAHKHAMDFDFVVIGWTFATRFYLQFDDIDLDFFPSRTRDLHQIPGNKPDINIIEDAYYEFHKHFYKLYSDPFIDHFSDMLVDSTGALCRSRKSKIIFFSWESRQCSTPVYRPFMPAKFLLPCGHMNRTGTEYLYQNLRNMIDE